MQLPTTATAAAIARAHVVAEVREALGEEWVAPTQILVSEVVTNAVVHGAGPIQMSCTPTDRLLHVEVTDHGHQWPVQREPAPLTEGGRGLQLIDALAHRWGVTRLPTGGKTVWFEVTDR